MEVDSGKRIRDWLHVPYVVFENDASWVARPNIIERQRLSRKHNAFFSFGEATFFVAYRNGLPAGRISAQVNHRHLAFRDDATGHFGFFETVDDDEVASRLIEKARAWLRARGMRRMVGPFAFTINEESGLLVDGFDTLPAIMSGHSRPWMGRLLEANGFAKEVDLLAYRVKPNRMPAEISRLATLARRSGRIHVRELDMAHYAREIATILDIFNDAWSGNWGFVPFSDVEMIAISRQLRPLIRGKFGRIVEIDGRPGAMMLVLPDINRIFAPWRGRLFPFNWAKLAYAIWADQWQSARVPLLGMRAEIRHTHLAPAVLSLLVSEFLSLARSYDLDWVELSWVLESNRPMVKLGELAAGPACKTYRVYAAPL